MNDFHVRTFEGPSNAELQAKYGDFLRDHTLPRPTGEEGRYRFASREELRAAQQQWDNARAKEQEIAQWSADLKAERHAAKKAEQDAIDQQRIERAQAERARIVADLKRSFLATPGTLESDWTPEREARELQAHFDRQRGQRDAQARAEARRLINSAF